MSARTIVVGGVTNHEGVRIQDELAADCDIYRRLLLVACDDPHLRFNTAYSTKSLMSLSSVRHSYLHPRQMVHTGPQGETKFLLTLLRNQT